MSTRGETSLLGPQKMVPGEKPRCSLTQGDYHCRNLRYSAHVAMHLTFPVEKPLDDDVLDTAGSLWVNHPSANPVITTCVLLLPSDGEVFCMAWILLP